MVPFGLVLGREMVPTQKQSHNVGMFTVTRGRRETVKIDERVGEREGGRAKEDGRGRHAGRLGGKVENVTPH